MMRDYRTIWLLSLLLAAGSCMARAQAAKAAPCENAMTQAEMNECSGKEYLKADERLNHVYRKTMEYLQHDLAQTGTDQAQKQWVQKAIDDLKGAELAWIKYRDLHCEAAGLQFEGGSMQPMIHSMSMSLVTEHCIDEIKQVYENGDRKLE